MAEPKAAIRIGLDPAELKAGLAELKDTIKGSFAEMNAATELLGKGFGALKGALGSLVEASKEWVSLAQIQEKAEARLTAALASRGEASKIAIDALKAQASEIQRLTVYGDEAILELQAELSLRGVATEKLQEATRATVGLSTVTNNLTAAGAIVAKVMGGNVEALKEVGIHAKNSQDGIRQLGDMFSVAEAQAQTFEGRLTQLTNGWGDFKEQLGFVITQNAAVELVFKTMMDGVNGLNEAFDKGDLKGALHGFITALTIEVVSGAQQFVYAIETIVGQLRTLETYYARWRGREDPNTARARQAWEDKMAAKYGFEPRPGDPEHAASDRLGQLLRELRGLDPDARRGGGAPGPGAKAGARTPRIAKPGKDPDTRHFDPEFGLDLNFAEADKALAAANSKNGFNRTTDDGGEMKDRLAAQYQEGMAFSKEAQAGIQSLAEGAASGLGNVLGSMIQAMVEGSATLGELLAGMVGMMIMNLGQLLLQTGAAAVALGALSLIPGLQFITGPPGVSIAAGAVAMGVGAGLVAIGSAMGAAAGPGATAPAASSGTAGGSSAPRAPFRSSGDTLPLGMLGRAESTRIEVHFNGVVGDPRAAARQIRDVMRQGNLGFGGGS